MIIAMFLTKDLLIDWRRGERHFMQHLIDGDLASNNGGWQWSASTGTDAAPYFRIFNPESQSRKFDPDGTFIRRYVPELADVEGDAIHAPAAKGLFASGGAYPEPIVDLKSSRERAIAAFRDRADCGSRVAHVARDRDAPRFALRVDRTEDRGSSYPVALNRPACHLDAIRSTFVTIGNEKPLGLSAALDRANSRSALATTLCSTAEYRHVDQPSECEEARVADPSRRVLSRQRISMPSSITRFRSNRRIEAFCATEDETSSLVKHADSIGFHKYRDVVPVIDRIGVTVFEFDKIDPAMYFEKAREVSQLQSEIFGKSFSPIERVMDGLRSVAPGAVSIASSDAGESYYAGLIRRIKSGTELHIDDAPAEHPRWEVGRVEARLALNVYLELGPGCRADDSL